MLTVLARVLGYFGLGDRHAPMWGKCICNFQPSCVCKHVLVSLPVEVPCRNSRYLGVKGSIYLFGGPSISYMLHGPDGYQDMYFPP